MTLIEAVQGFHSAVTAKPLSANARSLWLAIICLWNDRRRPSTITVGTPELRRLAGIQAKTSFHDALNALSSCHFVKIIGRVGISSIELEPLPFQSSNGVKGKALLNIPKTETEGAREAEPAVAKIENRTTGKYANMTLAQMIAARRAEKSSTKGATADDGAEHTRGNRSGKEVALGTDDKGRASDTGSGEYVDGGGFLSAGTQADIQGDDASVE